MKARVGLGILLAGLAMIIGSAAQAQSSRIVFGTDRTTDGDFDIWKMREDGSYPNEMTDESGDTRGPNISLTGAKILFDNRAFGGGDTTEQYAIAGDIFIMLASGGTPVNLTGGFCGTDDHCYDADAGPRINSAGDFRIVFSRRRIVELPGPDDYRTDIFMATVDISENELVDIIALTTDTDEFIPQLDPAWCGGDRVAWSKRGQSADPYQREICIMEVDESGPVDEPSCYFGDDGNEDQRPSCNSQGTQLAWDRTNLSYNGTRDIWVMDCDGTDCDHEGATNLMEGENHDLDDFHPTWAPSGTQIAFASDRARALVEDDMDLDIWAMDPNGSNKTNLTEDEDAHSDEDTEPDWGGASLGG